MVHGSPQPPHRLIYAASRVYFQRRFKYRSGVVLLTISFLIFLGISFICIGASDRDGSHLFIVATIFGFSGLLMLVTAVYLLVAFMNGMLRRFIISEEGIFRDGRLWSWETIQILSGYVSLAGSEIRFSTRDGFQETYQPWPPLTVEEYKSLAAILREEVLPKYPHLKIEVEPKGEN